MRLRRVLVVVLLASASALLMLAILAWVLLARELAPERASARLSEALGRDVGIGAVSVRLLPVPPK